VPPAVALYVMAALSFALAVWGAWRGLSERALKWMDFSAYSTAALGWYAFASGTIWAAESWGTPLALDPRQMSILVLALIFSLYPAIRRGVEDPERSVKLAQSFLIAGFALAIISFFAPVLAQALHPRPGTTLGGPLGQYMGTRILLVIAIFFALLFAKPARWTSAVYLAGVVVAVALLYPWLLY